MVLNAAEWRQRLGARNLKTSSLRLIRARVQRIQDLGASESPQIPGKLCSHLPVGAGRYPHAEGSHGPVREFFAREFVCGGNGQVAAATHDSTVGAR
jgi:hypothetical protein